MQGTRVQGCVRGTMLEREGEGQVEGGTALVSVGVTSCTHAHVLVLMPVPQVAEHSDHSPSCHL